MTPGHKKVPLGRLTVTPGHKKVPRDGRVDSQCLNLEDFALDDTTGMAVQIGNFKVLLLSDYSSFLLNYVHYYQLRWILGSSIPIGYSF